jgi:3-oxoacyl-ACP reductase-like protein
VAIGTHNVNDSEDGVLQEANVPALGSPAPAAKTPVSSPSSSVASSSKRIKQERGNKDMSETITQVLDLFTTTMAQKEHQKQVDDEDRHERRDLDRRLIEAKIKTEEAKQAAARAATTSASASVCNMYYEDLEKYLAKHNKAPGEDVNPFTDTCPGCCNRRVCDHQHKP